VRFILGKRAQLYQFLPNRKLYLQVILLRNRRSINSITFSDATSTMFSFHPLKLKPYPILHIPKNMAAIAEKIFQINEKKGK
jgi:hypothetical protein